MQHAQQAPVPATIAIYIILAAFIIFRYSRPMKMSVTRLFFMPVILLALTVFSIWTTAQLQPAPAWAVGTAIVIGVVFGVPLGIAMSAHRTVRRTEKPHVMYVEPSWLTGAIWLGAFILRAGVRGVLPPGAVGTIVGDGLLLFGISAVLTSYGVIYRKFRALDEAPQAA